MFPTKFRVNWPFGSGEGAKNRFLIGTILAIFDLQVTPMLPTKFSSQLAFRFKRRSEKYICHGNHLGFSIGTILTIFDQRPITNPMLTTVSSQLAQVCRRSRLLKEIVDAAWRRTDDAWRTLIEHNSSPRALRAINHRLSDNCRHINWHSRIGWTMLQYFRIVRD